MGPLMFMCMFMFILVIYVHVDGAGQGDAALGALIGEHFPAKFEGAFLHDINSKPTTGDGLCALCDRSQSLRLVLSIFAGT